ncbi:phosphoglycerate mutase [Mariprofundus sp. NF]|jgi:phosphohistidine phosphatase|uniref:SixA phosphatase family protein n=1 Tax=Mariprofundus sp. NF TaxID=2608716 RepID=UPI0015A1539D|nr:histidine phosphatase family protein [Mariprofundus sp. NF]NWF39082.1 phosphoglycerate mutase [Mariprofundus sp. NF]
MKQLILVRHAKSSWDDLSARDFDRDLNDRGRGDASDMGARLAKRRGFKPDAFLISSSQRTRSTAYLMADQFNFAHADIELKDELYLASPSTMLKVIRQTPDHVQQLIILAHNPGITELTNRLARTYINNVPTCGLAILEMDISSWHEVGSRALLLDFDYPKRLLVEDALQQQP